MGWRSGEISSDDSRTMDSPPTVGHRLYALEGDLVGRRMATSGRTDRTTPACSSRTGSPPTKDDPFGRAAAHLVGRGLSLLSWRPGAALARRCATGHACGCFATWADLVGPAAERPLAPTRWSAPDGATYPTGSDWRRSTCSHSPTFSATRCAPAPASPASRARAATTLSTPTASSSRSRAKGKCPDRAPGRIRYRRARRYAHGDLLLLAVRVTAASVSDNVGGMHLLSSIAHSA